MWTGCRRRPIWRAVERGLGKVAFGKRAPLDRGERSMLLAQIVQRLLDFLVSHDDFRFVRAQLFIALELDFRKNFKSWP